jgi:hypothetical protein
VRAGLFEDIDSLQTERSTAHLADVTCTRVDGSSVTVPVVTLYRSEDLIDDSRVVLSLAPVFG